MSFINTGGGGSGTVTSVTGTANQSSVATGTTTPVISVSNPFTFPGTVTNNLSIFAATTSAQLAGVISDETGSGALVFATSPTFITPLLGIPTSGTLTNCTGYTTANLSGLGPGVATFLATPSSANLAAAVTGETGTGGLVFATSPALTTPDIGAATGASLAVTGIFTSGANGGTAGQIALKGSTSGTQTLTTDATANLFTILGSATTSGGSFSAGTSITAGTTITTGASGGTAGQVIFNGSTSGSLTLTTNAGANTLTQGSGTFAVPIVKIGSGTSITKVLSATATLDFGSLATIGCEDLTITVTGAALGDTVAIGIPNGSIPSATFWFMGWVSSANTVTIRGCTLVSGDPASGTFRATVIQF